MTSRGGFFGGLRVFWRAWLCHQTHQQTKQNQLIIHTHDTRWARCAGWSRGKQRRDEEKKTLSATLLLHLAAFRRPGGASLHSLSIPSPQCGHLAPSCPPPSESPAPNELPHRARRAARGRAARQAAPLARGVGAARAASVCRCGGCLYVCCGAFWKAGVRRRRWEKPHGALNVHPNGGVRRLFPAASTTHSPH